MSKDELSKKILALLETSTVSAHHKERTTRLLPAMDLETLTDVYHALAEEKEEKAEIDEKEKRIKFKFQMLVDKMSGPEEK